MMARTKRSRRSYGAGEWGRNRVRVFPDSKTGLYQLEWRENGRRLTRSLGHREWVRAKRQADEFAAGFAGPDLNGKAEAEPEPPTLGGLLDIYGAEVTPTKTRQSRRHDRAAMKMFAPRLDEPVPVALGEGCGVAVPAEEPAGRAGRSDQRVGNRTIAWDLTFLMAVLNWAARSRDEQGRLLLDRNPFTGLRKPIEKNPNRVVLTEDEYQALLKVSRQVGWRFHVALVLAHETGHRIGAIRNLRWPDIDFEGKTIRWRAEHEKTGYEHRTPVTAGAIAALEVARRMSRGTGNLPVLPTPRQPTKCIGRVAPHNWWRKAQTLAGLEPKPGRGWHSLRRKFATDLMDLPLKVLCELGGWKSPQTVLRCYQQADEGQLRTALESHRSVRT